MPLFRLIASALRFLLALLNPAARRAGPARPEPGQAIVQDEDMVWITDSAQLDLIGWPALTDGSYGDLAGLLGEALSDMQARSSAVTAASAATATTTSPQEDPAVTTSALASYHHPHFISAEPHGDRVEYQFRPFTGRETEPRRSEESCTESLLTEADKDALHYEYRAAWDVWWQAKCRQANDQYQRSALYKLRQAAPDWAAYAAAEHWDRTARDIAWLREEHERSVGDEYAPRLADVAAGSGLDISSWLIDPYSSYTSDGYSHGFRTPLAGVVHGEIERQRKLLKDTASLASVPAAG